MNSSNFKQGDIIIAPIPFSNLVEIKLRPALIISSQSLNEDLIVLKITSSGKDYPFDVQLNEKSDLQEGTLTSKSSIQVDFPVVIEKESITATIGRISQKKLAEVKKKLKQLYEL